MNESVAISLLTLVPGISGGTETYARQLTKALSREGRLSYVAYVPAIAPDVAADMRTEIVTEYPATRSFGGRIAAMSMATLFPGRIRRRLMRTSPAVIHFPLSVMLPPVDHPGAVSTVHDLQHEVHPEFFSRSELMYRRVVYGWTVKKSAMVITVSDDSRRAIIERFKLSPERVVRIYQGVDHERFRPSTVPRQPFLFYPANRWRHKNHDTLFEAFHLIRARRPEMRLVLTGSGHERCVQPEGVDVLGRVDEDKLVQLYCTASALVYPSRYEGFGFPLLEAMASGCPVACSNVSSMPEVAGEAGALFDPRSPADIAGKVLDLLDSPARYVERGLKRAGEFTWSRTAQQHEDVYRIVMGRVRR